jgi:branched-chain amino acid transport system substrate-binding protein
VPAGHLRQRAEKLVQKDKVVALSGAFCSSATAAIMPVAEKYKIPLMTGVSSKADLTEKGMKYFFRAAETDRTAVQAFSKILANELQAQERGLHRRQRRLGPRRRRGVLARP